MDIYTFIFYELDCLEPYEELMNGLQLLPHVLPHVVDDLLGGEVRHLVAEPHLAPPGAGPAARLAALVRHDLAAGGQQVAHVLLGQVVAHTR